MEPAELSNMLKRLYVEARNVEGNPYSLNTMKAIDSKWYESIESYSAGPIVEQHFESSAIFSRFITKQNPDQLSLAAVSPHAI